MGSSFALILAKTIWPPCLLWEENRLPNWQVRVVVAAPGDILFFFFSLQIRKYWCYVLETSCVSCFTISFHKNKQQNKTKNNNKTHTHTHTSKLLRIFGSKLNWPIFSEYPQNIGFCDFSKPPCGVVFGNIWWLLVAYFFFCLFKLSRVKKEGNFWGGKKIKIKARLNFYSLVTFWQNSHKYK